MSSESPRMLVCAMFLALLTLGGCAGGDADPSTTTARSSLDQAVPAAAEYERVFDAALLTIEDVPTGWKLITAPPSEPPNSAGDQSCSSISSIAFSDSAAFIHVSGDSVQMRIYVRALAEARRVMDNNVRCSMEPRTAPSGNGGEPFVISPLEGPSLGEQSAWFKFSSEAAGRPIQAASVSVRVGAYIVAVGYITYGDTPVSIDQIAPFARAAARRLADAVSAAE